MGQRKSIEFEGDFDHSKAWQSQSVAGRYDEKRFSSWGGRAFNSMEKRSISALLNIAQSNDGIQAYSSWHVARAELASYSRVGDLN